MSTRPSSFKNLVVLASGAQAAGQFADWDAFLQSHGDAWGFYLDAATAEQQDEWLWLSKIRSCSACDRRENSGRTSALRSTGERCKCLRK